MYLSSWIRKTSGRTSSSTPTPTPLRTTATTTFPKRERVYGGRTESREPSSGGLNSSSSSLRTCFPPIASKVVPSLGICPFRSNKGCVRYWLYYYYSMHTATLTHEPFKASNVVSGGGYVMKHILACFNLRPTYKSDDGLFTCPIISAILHSAAAWCWLVVSIT